MPHMEKRIEVNIEKNSIITLFYGGCVLWQFKQPTEIRKWKSSSGTNEIMHSQNNVIKVK